MIKVGFDYDEPIFPWYDYAHKVSLAAGLADPEGEPPSAWDPTTTYGCTLNEWYDVINNEVKKGIDGMYGWPVKPHVAEAMRFMYRTGRYEIHLITARGQFGSYGADIVELTKSQLIREMIPHHSITFTQDKIATFRSLGLHYMLDDREPYYHDAVKANVEAYLLDERWNQDADVPANRRLFSTLEYIDLIMGRHGSSRAPISPAQRDHVTGARR